MRSRQSSKKPFKKKTYVWIGVCSLLIVLCGLSWYMVDAFWMEEHETTKDKQVSTSTQQQPEQKTASLQLPSKDDRALLKLIEPVEVNNKGDRYGISNADKVKLIVTAQKPTQITVNSSKGQEMKESLQAGDKQTFTDAKSISIEIGMPNQVILSVNGNTVDTSKQTKTAFYQFSLQDNN